MEWTDLLRLCLAGAAGGIIGLERELHDKPAGFRTNILICLGAALFTMVSQQLGSADNHSDITRIAAQVVSGVGFLGAGAIIQSRGTVIGLTTAATIWTVASVGMAFGAGLYLLGSAGTILAVVTLLTLSPIEAAIARWQTKIFLEVQTEPSGDAVAQVEKYLSTITKRCRERTMTKNSVGYSFHIALVGPEKELSTIQRDLMNLSHVRSLERM